MKIIKLRLDRLFFAIKRYKYLKRSFGIKYPLINALFGEIRGVKDV